MYVELHARAREEFFEAAERYDRDVPGLGMRFIDEMNHYMNLLVDSPLLGAECGSNSCAYSAKF